MVTLPHSDFPRISLQLNFNFCSNIVFLAPMSFLIKNKEDGTNPGNITLGQHAHREADHCKFFLYIFFFCSREFLLSLSNNSYINRVPPAPVAPVCY